MNVDYHQKAIYILSSPYSQNLSGTNPNGSKTGPVWSLCDRAFHSAAPSLWNALPVANHDITSLDVFMIGCN